MIPSISRITDRAADWSRRKKVFAAASVLGVIAIACGSSATLSDSPAATGSAPTTTTSSPTPAPAPTPVVVTDSPSAEPAATEPTAVPPEISTRTDDEGPLVQRRPLELLAEQSIERRATLLGWKTDFELRTINLSELFISLLRDSIAPIDDPTFESVEDATIRINMKEPVIVLDINDDARAYPLSILVNHEIVNDEVGGTPVTVTFCPLCNSSIAFDRRVDGIVHRFGTSGMLRKSDLVMWDDRTETLWQQLTGKAIVGEQAGKQLTFLPVQISTFEEFAASHPDGVVLNPPRSTAYQRTAYQGYDDNVQDPFLFFGEIDDRLPATARVVALNLGSGPVAYSFDLLAEHPVLNVVSGIFPIVIFFDDTTESVFRTTAPGRSGELNISGSSTTYVRQIDDLVLTFVDNGDGTFEDEQTGSIWDRFGEAISGELAGSQLDPIIHGDHFWFAWAAFEPDTELITDISQVQAS